MKAVVLAAPGPVEALELREVPVPTPEPGWVLIEVKAFGLNRSELKTRLGLADPDVTFPRVPGIEATGIVAACPGGELAVGQQVVAMMGGMGRSFDGGYAEFTCVPVAQTIPFRSELPWTTLGAVPETLQTAYGALTVGLDVQPGQTLLIRGGTSSVGLTAAILAKRRGLTVLATTRWGQGRRAARGGRRPRRRRRRRDRGARTRAGARRRGRHARARWHADAATAWTPRACTASSAARATSPTSGSFPTSTRPASCPVACA